LGNIKEKWRNIDGMKLLTVNINLIQNSFELISLETEVIMAPKIHKAEARHRSEKTALICL
jgi:hypothetical protein